MAREATESIVSGLHWTGFGLLIVGGLLIAAAILTTHSAGDLVVAAQAIGLVFIAPAIFCFLAGAWFEREASRWEVRWCSRAST